MDDPLQVHHVKLMIPFLKINYKSLLVFIIAKVKLCNYICAKLILYIEPERNREKSREIEL